MGQEEKVVARFKDGSMVKGYAKGFHIESDTVVLHESRARKEHKVPMSDLKALFFVKTFKGYRDYVERKAFGTRGSVGRKVFVKFSDRESLVGVIHGGIPWDRGYTLAKLGKNAKGFFLVPVDEKSNNVKVFVVGSAIQDITIMVA